MEWMAHPLIPRAAQVLVEQALRRSPVVAVVGPRQCGKTTLARQLVPPDSPNYFDLEDPVSLARLDQRSTALRGLAGVVVIDEVQHRPDLFPVLRVLADRDDAPARFLVLGSAGPGLLRQSAESLAGRIEYVELTGLQVAEVGAGRMPRLWVRGGFPRSFLADTDADGAAWRRAFLRAFVERDLPQFGAELGAPAAAPVPGHARPLPRPDPQRRRAGDGPEHRPGDRAPLSGPAGAALSDPAVASLAREPSQAAGEASQALLPRFRPLPPASRRRDDGRPADAPAHRRLLGGVRSGGGT